MDFVLVVQVREIYTETAKIQIGFTFLILAHLGSPGKRAIKRCVCVRACVRACVCSLFMLVFLLMQEISGNLYFLNFRNFPP